jgi:radical SAM protein with 4Fe4S-binding SPASM domain
MQYFRSADNGLMPPQGIAIMQSWHPRDRNCCWQAAAVNAFGRAIGCMYLREYVDFGDATQQRYTSIWNSDPFYRALRSGVVEKSCKGCAEQEGTHGGCRSTAYAFHGRWTAPDPFDEPLNDGVALDILPERIL